jgi:hypothetical protein
MLGIRLITNTELKRLRNVDLTLGEQIRKLKEENFRLTEKLAKFDRQRVNGKFIKKQAQ